MAGSVNKVTLLGNLGKDPESRSFANGGKVVSFSVATTDSWKDKSTGERKDKTEWHNVSIFAEGLCRVAEQYLKKGSKVYLEGQLETRKWQDQSGADRYTTDVVLRPFNSTLVLLDSRERGGGGGGGRDSGGYAGGGSAGGSTGGGYGGRPPAFDADLDDDVPFVLCDPDYEPGVRRRRVL
jgi:single-strand DNA-binding protein